MTRSIPPTRPAPSEQVAVCAATPDGPPGQLNAGEVVEPSRADSELEQIWLSWSVTEQHELTVALSDVLDWLVENDVIGEDAPRTLATVQECVSELDDWAAGEESGDTYWATTNRHVTEARQAKAGLLHHPQPC
ncbi:hypothetical protein [Micromonospora haikouensis]|uniref:hypothetical protein n=1 Tax=Micromonospora haikouensis TaxID=686309 RepID=UPI003D70F179